jgi:hypothetical protein
MATLEDDSVHRVCQAYLIAVKHDAPAPHVLGR